MNEDFPWLAAFAMDYVEQVCACVKAVVAGQVYQLIRPFANAMLAEGATIRAIGNGGSSAICQTLGWAAQEILGAERGARCVGPWDLYRLRDEVGRNGFETSAVRLLMRDNPTNADLILLISGSGNSRNLVAVAEYCLANSIPVIGLTGSPGGALGRLGVPGVLIESGDQQVIEDSAHATLHLVLRAVDALASGADNADQALARGVVEVSGALPPDIAWTDRLSSALARAAVRRGRVNVVAPEGGALGLSVEHFVHNLDWDLCHLIPDARLTVRSGISLADYTGIVNDSGAPGLAEALLLDGSSPGDVTVVMADDADHRSVLPVRRRATDTGLPVYGWYGRAARPEHNEDVALVPASTPLRALSAQVTGHLVLRAARAKIPRYIGHPADPADEEARAREPVAPLTALNSAPGSGTGTAHRRRQWPIAY
jgi:hypothetical protein